MAGYGHALGEIFQLGIKKLLQTLKAAIGSQ
jgi:hypothetical protein